MTLTDPETAVVAVALGAVDPPDHQGTHARSELPTGRAARALIAWVRAYQLLRTGRPTGCRFVPTCSVYAIEAIEQRGAVAGTTLAVRRLLRCGPWGGHGFDPVPEGRDTCTHP